MSVPAVTEPALNESDLTWQTKTMLFRACGPVFVHSICFLRRGRQGVRLILASWLFLGTTHIYLKSSGYRRKSVISPLRTAYSIFFRP
ncbi:unnamed protein product [Penicillium roqueforti FM164]|uniref:Genomic scaffold, ProqFM164S01 n=1 Tax=Penicillium roqueforti (strain FM164) TaxID=1365484 RepID=W6PX45_PENRF|nr:unnamed protein product [Penicillium roqueforti FM164]